jgi:phosphoribosylformimino-5-aminoimidazole carboxamide ribotide isomerase
MELFAAIDLREGGAVRLVQGDFERSSGYGDPLSLAQRFVEAGARWLHVVDLDAALTGQPKNRHLVKAIAQAVPIPVETGGGVRREADVDELLGAGVARVVLGTAALDTSGLTARCAAAHPGQVALGLDYRRGPDGSLEAAARGWTVNSGRRVAEVLEEVAGAPLGALVVTAIERDGTLQGPDLAGLAAVLDEAEVPVVASGGVGSLEDLRALAALRGARHGARLAGVVVGKALVDGVVSIEEGLVACASSG